MSTQSKLAGYIGIERPAILEALGLPTDDQTGLDQLWAEFAQLAATGTVGTGKTLSLVTEFPAEGDENTYYGLTSAIESETAPLTDPVADTPFNAFYTDPLNLSDITLDTPVSGASIDSDEIASDATLQVSLASTLFSDVISGGSARVFWLLVGSETIAAIYLDGEVTASGETYPAGWYLTDMSGGLPVIPFIQALDYEEFVKPNSIGRYTLSQEAIDAGFAVLFMTFTDLYARGIYDFDGTNFNLQLDLTDFSAQLEGNAMEISDLRSDVEELKAWKAEIEAAAEAANAGT